MVFFFTRSQKTRVFAQAASERFNMPVYELETDLGEYTTFRFLLKALGMVFRGAAYPVLNMPVEIPKEIYLCTPVWGGSPAAPAKYFLQNANLSGVIVNILLTASTPVEKYKENALKLLESIDCIPGKALVFAASSKVPPEIDVIKEHLSEMLGE